MSSQVEEIKRRLPVHDVISSYIKVEKAGSNYKARCPFHNEKTPSFFISPARDSFHCFGCNRGGDIFSFVEEIEGLDFVGSLKLLAERAGVQLSSFRSEKNDEKERLFKINEEATLFFQNQLKGRPDVLTYLYDRGLTEETIKSFRIGFAPDGWRNLTDHLVTKGYKVDELDKVGLIVVDESDKSKYYDRFRNRIMFPLEDSVSRVIGYSGRIFGENDKTGKYVNSPKTILYDKSNFLFGFGKAKQYIRQFGYTVIVEGQMDVIMAHQAGTKNTVAISGTALTENHLSLLHRLSDKIVMAFDNDKAGVEASLRSINEALAQGFEVKVINNDKALDPADIIKESPERWLKILKDTIHFIDFQIGNIKKKNKDSRTFKKELARVVFPYVGSLPNRIEREHFISEISRLTGTTEDIIREEVRSASGQTEEVSEVKKVNDDNFSRKKMLVEHLAGIIFWQDGIETENGTVSLDRAKGVIDLLNKKQKEYIENKKSELILRAEITYGGSDDLNPVISELTGDLHLEILKDDLESNLLKLKNAEVAENEGEISEYLAKCQEISNMINNLKIKNNEKED